MNLKPAAPDFTAPPSRKGPSVVGKIPPNTPPEEDPFRKRSLHAQHQPAEFHERLREVGFVNFAQLDETEGLAFHPEDSSLVRFRSRKLTRNILRTLSRITSKGQVVLYAIIRKDGSVEGIQLVHGVDPELDKDAMEAFARWKFRPGARDGAPVDLEAVVYIPFRYRPPAP